MSRSRGRVEDPAECEVRRTARRVGVFVAVASAALVIAVLAAVIAYVLTEIRLSEFFEARPDPNRLDIRATNLVLAGVALGIVAIVLAGTVGWLATRRAVRPLAEALRVQRQFVADASHELRTPLTVLDTRLQVLQRGLAPGDPSGQAVAALRNDTRALVAIVDDLLTTAELGRAPAAERRATDAIPGVVAAVDALEVLAHDRRITLDLAHDDTAPTALPQIAVQRCASALIDNALAHSPDGAVVRVTAHRHDGLFRVAVSDEGPGILGIDPSRIFERFAHSDAPVQTATHRTGFGIGLALVRDIVTRFDGSVEVVRTGPQGTEIAFTVPARDPAD